MENSCTSLCLFPVLDSELEAPIPSFSVERRYSLVRVFLDVSSAPVSTVTHTMNPTRPLLHTLSFPVPPVPTGEQFSFHATSSSPCLLGGGVRLNLGGENSHVPPGSAYLQLAPSLPLLPEITTAKTHSKRKNRRGGMWAVPASGAVETSDPHSAL